MGIVTVIVLGVVAITVVSVLGDMASKIAQARIKARGSGEGPAAGAELERLKERVALLESRIEERDDGLRKLKDELSFVTRMLEDRSGGQAPK